MEFLNQSLLELLLTLGNWFFSFAVFILLIYLIQIESFRSRTRKYKFISKRERRAMQGVAVLFAISVSFYGFVLSGLSLSLDTLFLNIVAGSIGLFVGIFMGYVLWTYFAYYHPFILEKRLNDIRFKPMKSPITGKLMTLLNEEQEDAHLSQEMIEEEESLAVDYDVWIDEESDYKVIERYDTRFHALICEHCHFRTLTESKEEVIKEPQKDKKGLLRKNYQCAYCGHMEYRDVDISSLDEEREFEKYEKDILEIPEHKVGA